LKFEEIADFLS